MDKLKSIGATVLAIAIFVGVIVGCILLFSLGVKASILAAPYIYMITGILFLVNVVTVIVALMPATRKVAGWVLFISSYIYGLAMWVYGLLVTLSLWGVIAIIIGLFLGGIGVVPIGMLAAIFNGRWDIFFSILIFAILTYGTRMIGIALAENHENNLPKYDDVIDIEIEDEYKRSWKDFE